MYCENTVIHWHQFLHSDPWVLEFVVSNTTGNNQSENCFLLTFNFRGLSEPRNPRKLKTPQFIMKAIFFVVINFRGLVKNYKFLDS